MPKDLSSAYFQGQIGAIDIAKDVIEYEVEKKIKTQKLVFMHELKLLGQLEMEIAKAVIHASNGKRMLRYARNGLVNRSSLFVRQYQRLKRQKQVCREGFDGLMLVLAIGAR